MQLVPRFEVLTSQKRRAAEQIYQVVPQRNNVQENACPASGGQSTMQMTAW